MPLVYALTIRQCCTSLNARSLAYFYTTCIMGKTEVSLKMVQLMYGKPQKKALRASYRGVGRPLCMKPTKLT